MVDVLETRNLIGIEVDGRKYAVALRVHHDGIEYVGRLWFSDEAWEDTGMPDRGAIPGRTPEEVWSAASRLRPEELRQRYDRAMAEKRRFHRLRRVTDEMLGKVRFMNQVAIAMRAGLLDSEGAAQEIELTERQLHELVDVLRSVAGIDS